MSSGTAMHGRQAGDGGDDGGEAAIDAGGRDGLTRAAPMGDDDDCLAMCGGCAADMDGGCGEVKRAWAEAGGGDDGDGDGGGEAATAARLRGCDCEAVATTTATPTPSRP